MGKVLPQPRADLQGGFEVGGRVPHREKMVEPLDRPVARPSGQLHVPQLHELVAALLLLGCQRRQDLWPFGRHWRLTHNVISPQRGASTNGDIMSGVTLDWQCE